MASEADEVRELIAEARAEARAEVKAILRRRFADAYLARAEAALEPKPREQPAPPSPPPPKPAAAEPGDVVWTYCVTEASTAAAPPSAEGVAGADVRVVTAAGLAALVSRVPRADFGEEPLKRHLNDLEWLEATARAHQQVLDAASAAGTIVPLRLCTIYAGEERVRAMLADEAERFREVLELLRGKSEWGVKVIAAPAAAPAEDAAGDTTEPAGGSAWFERKRRAQEARDEMRQALDEAVREVHARLEEWAVDAVVNRPQSRELAAYEGEMVLNAAYLIDDARSDEFAALVGSLEDDYRDRGLRFDLTGPWPPYNFVPGREGALL